jgi:hypothetical protein
MYTAVGNPGLISEQREYVHTDVKERATYSGHEERSGLLCRARYKEGIRTTPSRAIPECGVQTCERPNTRTMRSTYCTVVGVRTPPKRLHVGMPRFSTVRDFMSGAGFYV